MPRFWKNITLHAKMLTNKNEWDVHVGLFFRNRMFQVFSVRFFTERYRVRILFIGVIYTYVF